MIVSTPDKLISALLLVDDVVKKGAIWRYRAYDDFLFLLLFIRNVNVDDDEHGYEHCDQAHPKNKFTQIV
jgi:hypothetical protein